MAGPTSVALEVPDPAAAARFHRSLGVDHLVAVRASQAPTSGFRGFTLSLVVPGPGTVDALLAAALDGGGTPLKRAAKSLWGYGGTIGGPDGAVWKVATSARKDPGPVTREVGSVVLLLGVADVRASRRYYADRGLVVKRSAGSRYVEFDTGSSKVGLGLYRRRALAEDAGVPEPGAGSHRLVVGGDIGSSTDPDGFVWEAPAVRETG
jgi:hypothetical protein